jgi:Nitrate reductase delta subunit
MMAVPDGIVPAAGRGGTVTLNRWELLRALGAVAADPAAATALGLPPCGTAEHSEVFAFNCPPYASAYLGDDTARLAAFWTAIGLDVPAEPDHLSTLLGLYARLGEAEPAPGALRQAPLRQAPLRQAPLRQAPLRQVLFREHLWPWLPAYLGAVGDLPARTLAPWAALTLDALRREREPDGLLPLALREAPLAPRSGAAGLLDGLTIPLRSGIILTRRAVAAAADQIGAGQRIGDRRRALGAMLAAEPERTTRWLADEADRWSRWHLAVVPGTPGDPVQRWWADRAARTARQLRMMLLRMMPLGSGEPESVRVSAAD